MNILVFIIELLVLAVLFGTLIITMMTKNPESLVVDYPPDIQAVYYQTHEEKKEKLTVRGIIQKIISMTAALFVFAIMAHFAGATSYLSAALIIFAYVAWIAAFDTFFLDWVLFPRIKRWRLPGTEHMDKEYHQKWFHLKEVLKVAPLGIVYAFLSALIFIWIF